MFLQISYTRWSTGISDFNLSWSDWSPDNFRVLDENLVLKREQVLMCDSSSPLPQASAFDAKVALLLWWGLSKLLLWGQVIGIEKKFKGADKVAWLPSRSSEWVSQDIKTVMGVQLTLQEKRGTEKLVQAKLAELMWWSSWLITLGKGENESKNGVKEFPMKPIVFCDSF